MSIKEIIVTPALAKRYLDRNINNRKLNVNRVAVLAKAMQRGEWQFNGDTIRIAKSGRLLDGQHRLSAICESGIPQRCIIVDGLNDGTFTTIDTGASRKAGQMLSMLGQRNANVLAATSLMVLNMEASGNPVSVTASKRPTHSQVVELAESCEYLQVAARFGSCNGWVKRYIGPSIGAFTYYWFGRFSEMERDAFFDEIRSGQLSYPDSPIGFTRDHLLEERGSGGPVNKGRRLAFLFRTFSLFCDRKPAKIVRLKKDQSEWYKITAKVRAINPGLTTLSGQDIN